MVYQQKSTNQKLVNHISQLHPNCGEKGLQSILGRGYCTDMVHIRPSAEVLKQIPPLESLPSEVQNEIRRFDDEVRALEAGDLDPDEFKKFRLENGTYGIRFETEIHMVRVKIYHGNLTAEQLEAMALVAEGFTPMKMAHVTTRQNLQFHNIHRHEISKVMRIVNGCGLTTREACGNTVRNVSCCPYSGILAESVFDVTPYADAVAHFFLRNPVCQSMPRKFKISFESCPTDHIRTNIHDIGFVAKVRKVGGTVERGFQVYLGGGLGAIPCSAILLEEFTPEALMIPTTEAAIRIHDRHSNRENKNRARMKFLIKDWGAEKFRAMILKERATMVATRSGRTNLKIDTTEEKPPRVKAPITVQAPSDPAYSAWRTTNVFPQVQKGYAGVYIRCPLGDITAVGMRTVADVARRYCGGRIRTSITQNLFLRWIPEGALPSLFAELKDAGLAYDSAERVADITRCPGADTCNLAITHSRGLAETLAPMFADGLGKIQALQPLSIKISGCFNSCGQHHVADIGFYGTSKAVNGRDVPHYAILLGGKTTNGEAIFGETIVQVPARRVPEAVKALSDFFIKERKPAESFYDFVVRKGRPKMRAVLSPFTKIPPFETDPKFYEDLGAEGIGFKMEMGKGECAA